jgi:hypothetical protein
MRRFVVTLACTALLGACAAPGSSIGRIAFSGQIAGVHDRLSLEVTLPKHYGLGGLDLATRTPEDFGQNDKVVTVDVKDGAFSQEFGPIVYHVTFLLLPPLGAFPRHPPSPVYTVRFSNARKETYLIGMDGSNFRYEVYGTETRQKMKHEEAAWLLHVGIQAHALSWERAQVRAGDKHSHLGGNQRGEICQSERSIP